MAVKAGFEHELVRTDPFLLTAYYRLAAPGQPVHVYIEGDGYAFVTRHRASGDPTPRNPVGLKLAARDDSPNVVYLARPCQYTPSGADPSCKVFFWTQGRFAGEVVQSMNEAVSHFADRAQSDAVDLTGYSGGAAVALLLAERRSDIASLRTVAGNLDPETVNAYHGVPSLDGSLDPLEAAGAVAAVPQIHFLGIEDDIIPFAAAESFSKAMGPSPCFRLHSVHGASHSEGWEEKWPELLKMPVRCGG
jgi:hypothetical protein